MAAVLGIGFSGPVMAQEGTPADGAQSAATCDAVEPRDAEYFSSLAESPAATPAAEDEGDEQTATEATPVTAELPEGDIADDATMAEISGLYVTLIDCLNRGDYLRVYALYTEDYLLRNLNAESLALLEATPVPVEESTRSEFGGVLDARVLDDGRIAALITTSNPLSGDIFIRSTLVREDDALRIDEEAVVEAAIPATPDA
jgi:hypothetical protein